MILLLCHRLLSDCDHLIRPGRAFIRDIDIGDSGVVLGAERGVAPAEVSSFGCVAIEGRSFAMVFQNDKQFDQITMRAGTSQGT